MKINHTVQKLSALLQAEGVERKQGAGKNPENIGKPATDEVRISRLIQYLNQSLATGEASAVRTGKVAKLKAEIEAGTYFVSGQAVAEKMLEKTAAVQ